MRKSMFCQGLPIGSGMTPKNNSMHRQDAYSADRSCKPQRLSFSTQSAQRTASKSGNRTSLTRTSGTGRGLDAPPTVKKDLKVTNKTAQLAMVKAIEQFYEETCSISGCSRKLNIQGSSNDFYHMFESFVKLMFHDFHLPKSLGSIPEAIFNVLQVFGYTYCVKTHLSSVNSTYDWPFVLPALNFIKERAELFISTDTTQLAYESCSRWFEDMEANALILNFMTESLTPESSPHFNPDLPQQLEGALDSIFDLGGYDELMAQRNSLQEDIKNLRSQTVQLERIQQDRSQLEKDVMDIEKYVQEIEFGITKRESEIERIKAERAKLVTILHEKVAEVEKVQQQIRDQPVSEMDVDRMKMERQELDACRRHLERELDELKSEMEGLQMDRAKYISQLQGETSACNKLARQLDLVPCSAPLSKGVNFELPAHSTNGEDLPTIYSMVFGQIVARTQENAAELTAMEREEDDKTQLLKQAEGGCRDSDQDIEALQERLELATSNYENLSESCSDEFHQSRDVYNQMEIKRSQMMAKNNCGPTGSSIKEALLVKMKELEDANAYLVEMTKSNQKELLEYDTRLSEGLVMAVEHFSRLEGMEMEFFKTVERLTAERNALMTEFLNPT